VPGLLIAGIVFGTVLFAELPDNSGLASLVLSTRYRAGGVFAGAAAAFAVHVVLAVTCGSLLGLLPHKIVEIAVAVVFLAGAVLVLRTDDDDDDDAIAADPAAAVDRPAGRASDGRHGGAHPDRGDAVSPAPRSAERAVPGLQPARRHHAGEADQHDSGHDLAAFAGHRA